MPFSCSSFAYRVFLYENFSCSHTRIIFIMLRFAYVGVGVCVCGQMSWGKCRVTLATYHIAWGRGAPPSGQRHCSLVLARLAGRQRVIRNCKNSSWHFWLSFHFGNSLKWHLWSLPCSVVFCLGFNATPGRGTTNIADLKLAHHERVSRSSNWRKFCKFVSSRLLDAPCCLSCLFLPILLA